MLAAIVLCPCNVPVILWIFSAGALGGALTRNAWVLFVALAAGFVFAVWRAMARPKTLETCPACQRKAERSG